ncbi:MAG: hypothetical protein OIF58_11610, partial [Cohaesibacter sp.]|nr:hypothetical protein [Cohaesibacter sp.]
MVLFAKLHLPNETGLLPESNSGIAACRPIFVSSVHRMGLLFAHQIKNHLFASGSRKAFLDILFNQFGN